MSKECQALFRLLEEKDLMPDEYYLGDGYKNDLKLIIEALKRNEPMKVDPETFASHSWGDFYNCPNCGETVRIYDNYCLDCGQKLDWSEKLKKDDKGAKKMEQEIKDLIAEFEERLKEYRFNEQLYNGVDRVIHGYWTGMRIATDNALVELNKLLEV